MKLKNWLISIAVGVVLGILVVVTGAVNLQPVSARASSSEIVGLMANSHTKWSSVRLNAVTLWHIDAQKVQTVNTSILVQKQNKIRLETRQMDENGKLIVDMIWLMDGKNIYQQDNLRKQYTESKVPGFAKMSYGDMVSAAAKNAESTIYRHPFAMIMPSPIADYLYPVGLSQRRGIYKTKNAHEAVKQRDATVLDWQDETALNSQFKYWVDSENGVILKSQVLNPDGSLFEDTSITNIDFNAEIGDDAFVLLPPADFIFVPLSEFGIQ